MKPLEKFIKKPWTFPVTLLFIGLLTWGLYNFTLFYLDQTRPFKTKFPWEKGFDVTKFDLNDYKGHEELAEVFRHLFTPGVTTIADIDRVICNGKVPCLIEANFGNIVKSLQQGAYIQEKACFHHIFPLSINEVLYKHLHPGKTHLFSGWQLYFVFSEQEKILKNICSSGTIVFI